MFKTEYAKQYASEAEEQYRFSIFSSNMLDMAEMLSDHPSMTLRATRFSDLTDDEVTARRASSRPELITATANLACAAPFLAPGTITATSNLTCATPGCKSVMGRTHARQL